MSHDIDTVLALFRLVHRAIQHGIDDAATAAASLDPGDHDRVTGLVGWYGGISRLVHHHHGTEDRVILPFAQETQATFASDRARLGDQHERVAESVRAVATDLAALVGGSAASFEQRRERSTIGLRQLSELMREHLADEERVLFPVLRHATRADLKRIDREADRGLTMADMALMLPWLLDAATVEERALLCREVPWPVRLLNRWRWQPRFDRLVAPLRTSEPRR